MQRLFDFATTRPVLAASINFVLIAIGLGAALLLPIREYPNIDPPTVSVTTVYRGASAEVVEREVTKIVEDNLSGVEGIRVIRSTSPQETSQIDVEVRAGTDIGIAAADIRDKVSAVRSELPVGIEEPIIEKASADEFPMMYVTLRSEKLGTPELTDVANRVLTASHGAVSGVARVQIGGEKRYAMRVWLNVIVLVYVLLASQFESFLPPLIVLISAPMALEGGLVTLWLFGFSLNIYSQIGMVLLIGLVAKNAILLVEFANQLREKGRDAAEALAEAAAQRLRPILMTSIATILGAIPLVLESGAGAEARTTVGAVTAGGVTLGTLLTLFVVPAAYAFLGRYTTAPGEAQQELERLEREHPEGDAPAEDRARPQAAE